jgi:hypothetical protein
MGVGGLGNWVEEQCIDAWMRVYHEIGIQQQNVVCILFRQIVLFCPGRGVVSTPGVLLPGK